MKDYGSQSEGGSDGSQLLAPTRSLFNATVPSLNSRPTDQPTQVDGVWISSLKLLRAFLSLPESQSLQLEDKRLEDKWA